uniref:Uncharacterized protein n=2 Tax=Archaeoglobaceae TaxID=2232 RepID=A0A7C4S6C6_9EURY
MLDVNLAKRVEELERRVRELESIVKGRILIVREISRDEARKLLLDYLKDKKGEIVTPLTISEGLQIFYEIAHSSILELIKDGKLQPAGEYNE